MTESEQIMNSIKERSNVVEKFLNDHLNGKIKNLWDASRHYILAGGKRLRPFMVFSSYNLLQEDISAIIPIASAVEILHNFTLIHDDIMDQDAMRRNVPTVHTKWGEPIAILAGDLLFALVFVFVNRSTLPSEMKSRISAELGQVSVDLCNGQALDMNFEKDSTISISDYLEMCRLKTGALFKTSMKVGGIAANMNREQSTAVETFGEKLGIGFQIADDILGLLADEKKLGKPVGSDIREGKKTYLLLWALDHLESAEKAQLIGILAKKEKSDSEIEFAKKLIIKSGAVEQAQQQAEEYISNAIHSLAIFPQSKARQDLEKIARLSVKREF